MNVFSEYLFSNWSVDGVGSIMEKFTHSVVISVVKGPKGSACPDRERKDHVLLIGLKWFDRKHKLLASESIKFVNNLLNAPSKKKLNNISSDELENMFMRAKPEILNVIKEDYTKKMEELDYKLGELDSYYDFDTPGCNKEFKGEHIEVGEKVKKQKAVFDM